MDVRSPPIAWAGPDNRPEPMGSPSRIREGPHETSMSLSRGWLSSESNQNLLSRMGQNGARPGTDSPGPLNPVLNCREPQGFTLGWPPPARWAGAAPRRVRPDSRQCHFRANGARRD
jgi:hypothetical protein